MKTNVYLAITQKREGDHHGVNGRRGVGGTSRSTCAKGTRATVTEKHRTLKNGKMLPAEVLQVAPRPSDDDHSGVSGNSGEGDDGLGTEVPVSDSPVVHKKPTPENNKRLTAKVVCMTNKSVEHRHSVIAGKGCDGCRSGVKEIPSMTIEERRSLENSKRWTAAPIICGGLSSTPTISSVQHTGDIVAAPVECKPKCTT